MMSWRHQRSPTLGIATSRLVLFTCAKLPSGNSTASYGLRSTKWVLKTMYGRLVNIRSKQTFRFARRLSLIPDKNLS
jgi:hypothetical protein